MGRESSVMRDEFELSLELSIGGCYSKSEKKNLVGEKGINDDDGNLEVSRSDFSGGENGNAVGEGNGCELADPLKRREIRALKRREARIRQSRGLNDGGFIEDKVQQFHGGGEDREMRETADESAAKREKIEAEKLNTSVVRVSRAQQTEAQFSLPIGKGFAFPWVAPSWGSNVGVAGERGGKSSGDEPENAAAQPSSSSLHRTTWTSHREGSSSDSGSHSSSFATNRNRTDHNIEPIEVNNSSTQDEISKGVSSSIQMTKIVQGSTVRKRLHSDADKPSPPPTSSSISQPPQMPRVSTTGNGPNGKTITGFLYKYMESEVRIMCACHGSFFSPAEFVEHAGGVDVAHPLRHITVDPRAVKR